MPDVSNPPTLGPGRGGAGERWTLAAGATLGGCRVIRPLGSGGMGEVYLAEQVSLSRQVALKIMRPERTASVSSRARFLQEGKAVARLKHPGIAQVYDMGEHDGRVYIAMEYVDGPEGKPRTLADDFAERGRYAEDEAKRLTLEMAEALRAAHTAGILHRDLKPGNVLLDATRRAKLSDFGLAKVVAEGVLGGVSEARTLPDMPKTLEGAGPGTPDWMAPEQKRGRADYRSDIYSLGMMIYHMLTGERPEGRFPDPSELGRSRWWDVVIQKTLASQPERRYETVSGLIADVETEAGAGAGGAAADAPSLRASPDGRAALVARAIEAGMRVKDRRSRIGFWVRREARAFVKAADRNIAEGTRTEKGVPETAIECYERAGRLVGSLESAVAKRRSLGSVDWKLLKSMDPDLFFRAKAAAEAADGCFAEGSTDALGQYAVAEELLGDVLPLMERRARLSRMVDWVLLKKYAREHHDRAEKAAAEGDGRLTQGDHAGAGERYAAAEGVIEEALPTVKGRRWAREHLVAGMLVAGTVTALVAGLVSILAWEYCYGWQDDDCAAAAAAIGSFAGGLAGIVFRFCHGAAFAGVTFAARWPKRLFMLLLSMAAWAAAWTLLGLVVWLVACPIADAIAVPDERPGSWGDPSYRAWRDEVDRRIHGAPGAVSAAIAGGVLGLLLGAASGATAPGAGRRGRWGNAGRGALPGAAVPAVSGAIALLVGRSAGIAALVGFPLGMMLWYARHRVVLAVWKEPA